MAQQMNFQAEVARLLDLMVHSIYSDKEVFLRELISNAADACDKLRYLSVTQPELLDGDDAFSIKVNIDPAGRTITVSDNGVGMTRDEIVENLGTIARSGTSEFLQAVNDDSKNLVSQIGQFGVGFYSAFMVAQAVEVHSKKAGAAESWSWQSDGKGAFSIEEGDKSSRGTDIVVYLKQGFDQFLDAATLKSVILKYSDHIALPIFVDGEDKPSNAASALWLKPKNQISEQQLKEFYHYVAHAFDDPAFSMHWKAEGRIEYSGLLFIPSMRPYDLFDPKREHGVKLYVKRVFITDKADGLVPHWLRFLRGVVDSEDLPLNISREMLQHNPMLSKIRQGITNKVLSELGKFAKERRPDYEKMWDNFGAVIKEGIYEDIDNRNDIAELVLAKSTYSDEYTTLKEYVSRMKEGQDAIFYVCGEDAEKLKKSPHLEGFIARGIEVLLLTDTVDDFWTGALGKFEEKTIKSVTVAAEDLSKIPEKEKKKEDEKAKDFSEMKELIAAMRRELESVVKAVNVSDRLTSSPVCLTAEEGDIDMHLERFLKKHNQIKVPSKRVLEINASHPLIEKLAKKVKEEKELSDSLKDMIWLLFDQAKLMDGDTPSDAASFSRRLDSVLQKVLLIRN
ncbi:MAG: molecular chaperone HtpG [Alphaproteobacteria bacterium]|nr:molecular chaperone HtpG [Alphaproteobacteria bacterium]MCL2505676.1 molecular chaperone HtpG [Alphaproteobacteria bacterium]